MCFSVYIYINDLFCVAARSWIKIHVDIQCTYRDKTIKTKMFILFRTAFTDTGLLNGFVFSFSIKPLVWFVQ